MSKGNNILTAVILTVGAVALEQLLMKKVVAPIVAHIWWNS